MLTIERIVLREIRLPLKEPFETATGRISERRIALVEAVDVDGAAGWGECVALETPHYLPETIDTAWVAMRDWVGPRVLRIELASAEYVRHLLDVGVRGHGMAKAAVEMAMWDLAAKKEGRSLASLLGGTQERVATGIALGIQDGVEALAEKAARALGEGYRKVKIKIKPGADVAYVEAVCAALGGGERVAVDANGSYALEDEEGMGQLDGFGLMMIEQPLGWDDLLCHAELQAKMKTPICLDESVRSVDHVEDMITLGSGKILNLKPGRVGGLGAAKEIHDICQEEGVGLWCGGMLESGIGRAHNVALASLPHFQLPGDLSPSSRYWEQDIVSPEWVMDGEGFVKVPFDRPGIGVEVDVERVKSLTVREETLKPEA